MNEGDPVGNPISSIRSLLHKQMDKLEEIMNWKRQEVSLRERPVSELELEKLAERFGRGISFYDALANPDELSIIAEIKRKSPSAGSIAEGISALEQARTYYNANADALSVLTDEKFFGGKLEDLWEVNDFLQEHQRFVPTLRKDFMVHPIQILEALEAGARAILLIVRVLDDDELETLRAYADAAGMDCLYEVHEEHELEKALKHNPKILGVNNRDLTRFVIDLETTERLFPLIPEGIVKVSESGILVPEDAWRVREAGAEAVLCGEALMKAESPENFISEMKDA